MTARRQHLVAALVFACCTGIFFAPVLAGRHFTTVYDHQSWVYPWAADPPSTRPFPPQADEAALGNPWHSELAESLDEGTLPYWIHDTFAGGYPFATDGVSGIAHPVRLLGDLWLHPLVTHDLMSVLHVFLAGLFTYFLMRNLGIGMAGAVLSGVSWMLASFNLAWLEWDMVGPVAPMLPLDLWLVRVAWQRRTVGSSMGTGLVLGLTLVVGHALFMGMTCVVAGVYAAALAVGDARRAQLRRAWSAVAGSLLRPALMVVTALGAAAVVLLPTAANLASIDRQSFRYADLYVYDEALANRSLAPPRALLGMVVPTTEPFTQQANNDQMSFVGTVPAALALLSVGAVRRRRGAAVLGAVLLLVFALAAVGGPVTWLMYHLNPIGRVFKPYGRLFQWSTMGLSILGGVGLDEAMRWRPLHFSLRPRVRAPHVVAGIAVVVTAIQLVTVGRGNNAPFAPKDTAKLVPATPLIRAMQAEQRAAPWPARSAAIYGEGTGVTTFAHPLLLGNANLLFDLRTANGYDSAVPTRTAAVLRYAEGESLASAPRPRPVPFIPLFRTSRLRYPVLERLGVGVVALAPTFDLGGPWRSPDKGGARARTLYSGPDGNLIRISSDPAVARVVTRSEVVAGGPAALKAFTASRFEWRRKLVLEAAELARVPAHVRAEIERDRGTAPDAHVLVTPGRNALAVRYDTARAGWLVVPESWDRGWSARLDGREVPVLRANYSQMAIPVTAGHATLRLRFTPPGLALGALASAATVALTALAAMSGVVRRSRQRRRSAGAA